MKSFIVIGLGKFGLSVAKKLTDIGHDVLAVDKEESNISEIADIVTRAIIGNATDPAVIDSLGVRNFDAVIVGAGDNMEASIMTTAILKEKGAPFIVAKAKNEMHGKILSKVGADRIVYPEEEIGERVARQLSNTALIDMLELSDSVSIAEIAVPDKWVGSSVRELNVRARFGINIIAVKSGKNFDAQFSPDLTLEKEHVLIMIGDNSKLDKIR